LDERSGGSALFGWILGQMPRASKAAEKLMPTKIFRTQQSFQSRIMACISHKHMKPVVGENG
jgi:hypothetical protein